MPDSWAREEVDALVADYFNMLDDELCERRYNKTAHRAALLALLHNRNEPAVEFKRANVSAVLIELGFPFITGYKPRGNYQQLLREVVVDRLRASPSLIESAAVDVETVPDPSVDDVLGALVDPPARPETRTVRSPTVPYADKPNPLPVNFLEREAHNRRLGAMGEKFVVAFEQARLVFAGKDRLAANVEHVAQTQGDGVGFDVRSFNDDGSDRFVEVKTTKYGAETPFFLSRNEVSVSEQVAPHYHLYRVFEFRKRPKLFTLAGSVRHSCTLEPESFIARVA